MRSRIVKDYELRESSEPTCVLDVEPLRAPIGCVKCQVLISNENPCLVICVNKPYKYVKISGLKHSKACAMGFIRTNVVKHVSNRDWVF